MKDITSYMYYSTHINEKIIVYWYTNENIRVYLTLNIWARLTTHKTTKKFIGLKWVICLMGSEPK